MAEEQIQEETPKRKLNLKTLIILGVVLFLEVATVLLTFVLAGGPNPAAADRAAAVAADKSNQEVEELVIQGRFANSKRGDVYLYDTEIYVVVLRKHQEKVQEQLKRLSAQMNKDIGDIFRRAEPSFMHEDELQTLTRQVKEVLDERLGPDAEGESLVKRVLITRCIEYPANL